MFIQPVEEGVGQVWSRMLINLYLHAVTNGLYGLFRWFGVTIHAVDVRLCCLGSMTVAVRVCSGTTCVGFDLGEGLAREFVWAKTDARHWLIVVIVTYKVHTKSLVVFLFVQALWGVCLWVFSTAALRL